MASLPLTVASKKGEEFCNVLSLVEQLIVSCLCWSSVAPSSSTGYVRRVHQRCSSVAQRVGGVARRVPGPTYANPRGRESVAVGAGAQVSLRVGSGSSATAQRRVT